MGTDSCLSAERFKDPSLRLPQKRARAEKCSIHRFQYDPCPLNLIPPPIQRNPCCAARKTICWSHLHAPDFFALRCASAFALRFCISSSFFVVYWINVCDEYIYIRWTRTRCNCPFLIIDMCYLNAIGAGMASAKRNDRQCRFLICFMFEINIYSDWFACMKNFFNWMNKIFSDFLKNKIWFEINIDF